MLLKLSREITKQDELIHLAVTGLGLDISVININVKNNQQDFTAAVLAVFKEWQKSQSDDYDAYHNLCEALTKADMPLYIKALT